ncbi:MAG: hypothetical protein ACOC2H_02635, partial [Spirochaetota bacterium]
MHPNSKRNKQKNQDRPDHGEKPGLLSLSIPDTVQHDVQQHESFGTEIEVQFIHWMYHGTDS